MRAEQPPRVVLFDLFNTLIPGGAGVARQAVSYEIAADLGVDPTAFADLVWGSFDARMRGELGDTVQTLASLAAQLGVRPSGPALSVGAERRRRLTRDLHELTWALPALTALRRAGVVMGLVSDCSSETPEVWGDSPLAPFFTVTSFSCVTGHCKPDPEAYRVATAGLGVEPSACLYVGDGAHHELDGAAALGMTAVKYAPAVRSEGVVDPAPEWTGPAIDDLMQVLGRVEHRPAGPVSEPARVCEFAFPGPLRDRLVAAVLSGAKTATTSLLAEWEADGDALPRVGEEETVIDSAGRPVATIVITAVGVTELASVDDRIARAEGEDYTTAAGWRAEHERFWREEVLARWERGRPPTIGDATQVVVQWFRVTERL